MATPAPQQQSLKKQHAIPQHVLGVEFKLVGNFTIKQFGILAGGVVSRSQRVGWGEEVVSAAYSNH